MKVLSRIFFSFSMFGNVLILLLGLYGHLWRSRFLSGDIPGPYWLLELYNSSAPVLFYVAAMGLGLFWVLRLIGGLFRVKTGDGALRLSVALRLAVLLGSIAAIPACQTDFVTLQTIDFNNEQFHLVQQKYSNGVSYAVFRCEDVGSFYCDVAGAETPWLVLFPEPPPTPLPLPTVTAVVEGEVILLEPRAPTVTPPAELMIQPFAADGRQEEQLALKIGDAWLGIEISGPTPTPFSTPLP